MCRCVITCVAVSRLDLVRGVVLTSKLGEPRCAMALSIGTSAGSSPRFLAPLCTRCVRQSQTEHSASAPALCFLPQYWEVWSAAGLAPRCLSLPLLVGCFGWSCHLPAASSWLLLQHFNGGDNDSNAGSAPPAQLLKSTGDVMCGLDHRPVRTFTTRCIRSEMAACVRKRLHAFKKGCLEPADTSNQMHTSLHALYVDQLVTTVDGRWHMHVHPRPPPLAPHAVGSCAPTSLPNMLKERS